MIFKLKHSAVIALIVTLVWATAGYALGGWRDMINSEYPVALQVLFGLAGGGLALALNGVLHAVFSKALGDRYERAFQRYGREILKEMRWPEYIMGGLMAALAEEPFFRGVLLRAFDSPVLGISFAALAFALCHWLRFKYFGFWIWALWEWILFGLLLVLSNSLLVPMIAHGVHDVAAYSAIATILRKEQER